MQKWRLRSAQTESEIRRDRSLIIARVRDVHNINLPHKPHITDELSHLLTLVFTPYCLIGPDAQNIYFNHCLVRPWRAHLLLK